MNRVSPKKLLNTKWTATQPKSKEKHFMIVEVEYDEDKNVVLCIIEAVMTQRQIEINWRDLSDNAQWLGGWQ